MVNPEPGRDITVLATIFRRILKVKKDETHAVSSFSEQLPEDIFFKLFLILIIVSR